LVEVTLETDGTVLAFMRRILHDNFGQVNPLRKQGNYIKSNGVAIAMEKTTGILVNPRLEANDTVGKSIENLFVKRLSYTGFIQYSMISKNHHKVIFIINRKQSFLFIGKYEKAETGEYKICIALMFPEFTHMIRFFYHFCFVNESNFMDFQLNNSNTTRPVFENSDCKNLNHSVTIDGHIEKNTKFDFHCLISSSSTSGKRKHSNYDDISDNFGNLLAFIDYVIAGYKIHHHRQQQAISIPVTTTANVNNNNSVNNNNNKIVIQPTKKVRFNDDIVNVNEEEEDEEEEEEEEGEYVEEEEEEENDDNEESDDDDDDEDVPIVQLAGKRLPLYAHHPIVAKKSPRIHSPIANTNNIDTNDIVVPVVPVVPVVAVVNAKLSPDVANMTFVGSDFADTIKMIKSYQSPLANGDIQKMKSVLIENDRKQQISKLLDQFNNQSLIQRFLNINENSLLDESDYESFVKIARTISNYDFSNDSVANKLGLDSSLLLSIDSAILDLEHAIKNDMNVSKLIESLNYIADFTNNHSKNIALLKTISTEYSNVLKCNNNNNNNNDNNNTGYNFDRVESMTQLKAKSQKFSSNVEMEMKRESDIIAKLFDFQAEYFLNKIMQKLILSREQDLSAINDNILDSLTSSSSINDFNSFLSSNDNNNNNGGSGANISSDLAVYVAKNVLDEKLFGEILKFDNNCCLLLAKFLGASITSNENIKPHNYVSNICLTKENYAFKSEIEKLIVNYIKSHQNKESTISSLSAESLSKCKEMKQFIVENNDFIEKRKQAISEFALNMNPIMCLFLTHHQYNNRNIPSSSSNDDNNNKYNFVFKLTDANTTLLEYGTDFSNAITKLSQLCQDSSANDDEACLNVKSIVINQNGVSIKYNDEYVKKMSIENQDQQQNIFSMNDDDDDQFAELDDIIKQ